MEGAPVARPGAFGRGEPGASGRRGRDPVGRVEAALAAVFITASGVLDEVLPAARLPRRRQVTAEP